MLPNKACEPEQLRDENAKLKRPERRDTKPDALADAHEALGIFEFAKDP